ncbi:tRNA pseudouridine(38-40) synthase TruA [Camelliibacillus cellulosilyticus]|uniref:tRNA pseudouridine synthase A n=1 Tax=Camelliibacillus cellulosilyticus TaxID=2174486 RepID=A0ABV9GU80_9BACL
MPRIKCTIAYDGTRFAGYQMQPDKRTVQSELEHALQKMHKGQRIRVTASGRTDAGVHANGQVIHFDSPLHIQKENWGKALNTLLPDDIFIREVERVSEDFHARFSAKQKEYRYRLLNRLEPDLFRRLYTLHVPKKLDLDLMRAASHYITGTHDFTAFCASGSSVMDKVRTVYEIDIQSLGDEVVIRMIGNGFLYQMVRIAVGHLLAVGLGKHKPEVIADILETRDRRKALGTAPPQGLFLWQVKYV